MYGQYTIWYLTNSKKRLWTFLELLVQLFSNYIQFLFKLNLPVNKFHQIDILIMVLCWKYQNYRRFADFLWVKRRQSLKKTSIQWSDYGRMFFCRWIHFLMPVIIQRTLFKFFFMFIEFKTKLTRLLCINIIHTWTWQFVMYSARPANHNSPLSIWGMRFTCQEGGFPSAWYHTSIRLFTSELTHLLTRAEFGTEMYATIKN